MVSFLNGQLSTYLAKELCYVADTPSSPVVDLQSAGCPTVTPRYILLVTVHLPQLHVPGPGTVVLVT